jgi:beta-galactosidase
VGNEVENQGTPSMLAILEKLVAKVKELDASRPVTCALIPFNGCVPSVAEIAEKVDILALNYHEQWFDEIHKAVPDKLIISSEAYCYFRGSYANRFSYDTKNPWLSVVANDYAIGSFLWAGVDYIGESMGYPSKGWCGSIIRSNNEPRPIAKLFESFWSDKPVVHITTLDYTQRDEFVREHWAFPPMIDCWNYPMYRKMPIPYMIFTNCEQTELTLNGIKYDAYKNGYLMLEVGVVYVRGLNGGETVCEHEMKTSGEAVKLIFKQQTLKLPHDPCGVKQALLTVYAVDKKNVRCMRESGVVTFTAEGDGIIEGVDNGAMSCEYSFKGSSVNMLHGAASVVVRTTANEGRIIITANCGGMISAVGEVLC